MIKSVGLIDYDAIAQKKYISPNYDLGITYQYLKQDPNINVRLITSLTERNLNKYDKIYLFKISQLLPHPASKIKDYYKRNIEEYGCGFDDRPIRPFFIETLYLLPDFTCYNPILQFSIEKPKHPMAWKFHGPVKGKNYSHIKLFEDIDSEIIRKDLNTSNKRIALYDNSTFLLSNQRAYSIVNELLENHIVFFTQPLDISCINDTNILERVITDPKMATLRKKLVISTINSNALWFINYFLEHKCKKTDVVVLYKIGEEKDYYLRSMLQLNYFNNRSNYTLRLRPYYDKDVVMTSPLAHLAYRFLYETPYLMSYYEYVFYMGCKNDGIPEKLVRTNEDVYEFILSKYGMPQIVKELENWIRDNPDYEEQIFIGGTSKYEECRRNYYDTRGSKFAFRTSTFNSSKELSSQ